MGMLSALAVVTYVFVSLVLVSPNTPVRAAVFSVASPYYTQKWNVFAPSIMKVNTDFSFQAQWRDANGSLVKSEWVNITDIEQGNSLGNWATSRIHKQSLNAMGAYQGRYNKLTAAQKKIARDTFIERSGNGFQPIGNSELIQKLVDAGNNRSSVISFLRFDAEQQFKLSDLVFGWRQSNVTIDGAVVNEYAGVIERNGGKQ
ncbi:hypothetical protein BLJ79_06425 [Arthrobacter sp. UCD-GKA]|nr:hypothetical protein BLJ79_06425 [Arthrobacter sp. UCD-GKA]